MQKTIESSKYHKYEVEDIVLHFLAHIQEALRQGTAVKLNGIGTIDRKLYKPLHVTVAGQDKMVYNSVGLSIKKDSEMTRLLKEYLDATGST